MAVDHTLALTTSEDENIGLIQQIIEDQRAHESWIRPGFHAVAVHRFGVWRRRLPLVLRAPVSLIYYALQLVVRYVYGIELASTMKVGRRLRISHHGGIVIHYRVEIGDDCTITHNVTIGATESRTGIPKIGNGVIISAGAVIVGNVIVGDDARIGPNAVVVTNVPPGATVFAEPARVQVRETAAPAYPDDSETEPSSQSKTRELINLIESTIGISAPIDAETPLLSSGLIDSIQVVALLTTLEDGYGVTIRPEQVDADSFDTPAQMLATIEQVRQ